MAQSKYQTEQNAALSFCTSSWFHFIHNCSQLIVSLTTLAEKIYSVSSNINAYEHRY